MTHQLPSYERVPVSHRLDLYIKRVQGDVDHVELVDRHTDTPVVINPIEIRAVALELSYVALLLGAKPEPEN